MEQLQGSAQSIGSAPLADDVFDIDGFEDVSSAEYTVRDPATDRPTKLILILAGPEHPLRKKKQFNRIRKLRKGAANTGKVQLDDPADEDEATTREIAEYILGWRGLVRGGYEVPFSYEEALKLMLDKKRRWLRDQVKAALDERELFIKTCSGN